MMALPPDSAAGALGAAGSERWTRFTGRASDWNIFKMRVFARLDAQELGDMLRAPLAPTDEEVRALLSGALRAETLTAEEDGEGGGTAAVAAAAAEMGSASASSSSEKKKTKKDAAATPPAGAAVAGPSARGHAVKKSRRAYQVVIDMLGDAELRLVQNVSHGDAFGVWKILTAKFERKTQASKYHTRHQLHSAKLERGEKLDAYIARLQEIEGRLRAASSTVTEEEMVYVLLEGLPSQYETLILALRMRDELGWQDTVEKLRDFHESKALGRADDREKHSAHYARVQERIKHAVPTPSRASTAPRPQQLQQPSSEQRNCFCCGKAGHVMFDCTRLPSTTVKCSKCRVIGHVESSAQCQRMSERRAGRFAQRGGRQEPRGQARIEQQEESAAAAVDDSSSDEEEDWAAFACVDDSAQTAPGEFPNPLQKLSAWRKGPPSWVADSGTTTSLTNDLSMLVNVRQIAPVRVRVANNQVVTLTQGGDALLPTENGTVLRLKNVAYHPSIAAPLLSVKQLVDGGASVTFERDEAVVRRSGRVVARVPRRGNLYLWPHQSRRSRKNMSRRTKRGAAAFAAVHAVGSRHDASAQEEQVRQPAAVGVVAAAVPAIVVHAPDVTAALPAVSAAPVSALLRLHQRLGHWSRGMLKSLIVHKAFEDQDAAVQLPQQSKELNQAIECTACELGKATRQAFGRRDVSSIPTEPMDEWSCDLSGPIRSVDGSEVAGHDGSLYLSLITDRATGKVFVRPLRAKSDAAAHIMGVHRKMTVLLGRPLKRLHSDGGGEYQAADFLRYFEQNGVDVTSTPAYTPQLNGDAERENGVLFNVARTLLLHAGLPASFWALACEAAAYLRGLSSSRGSSDPKKTIDELFFGRRPKVGHLRVFGCDAFVWRPGVERGKMDARARRGIFVGYDARTHAYRVWCDGAVVISRDVKFLESSFSLAAQMRHEIEEAQERDERQRVDAQEEKYAEDAAAPAEPSRRAGRAAAHRLYQPWDAETEREQLRRAQQLSLWEERQRARLEQEEQRTRAAQEELEAAADAPDAAGEEPSAGAAADAADAARNVASTPPRRRSTAAAAPKPARFQPAAMSRKRSAKQSAASGEEEFRSRTAAAAPVDAAASRRSTRARDPVQYSAFVLQAPAPKAAAKGNVDVAAWSASRAAAAAQVCAAPPYVPAAGGDTTVTVLEPRTHAEAMASPQAPQWQAAVDAELASLLQHGVYEEVDAAALGGGKRPIGSKWVFKVKHDALGAIERFKARLVAKGFSQREGEDFFADELFAPTLMLKTLRVLLCIAAVQRWHVQQMDVETAFLNGEMREEVYMRLPPGVSGAGTRRVWRLRKALYGTKQASRVWNEHVDSTLRSLGFAPCRSEPCLYTRRSRTGSSLLLGLFVDDLITVFAPSDMAEWCDVKSALSRVYSMKDLGAARKVLGMTVTREGELGAIQLSQAPYVDQMLQRFHMQDAKPMDTPEAAGVILSRADAPGSEDERERMRSAPYLSLVGSLLYAAQCTRPDIAHAVAVLTRFCSDPGERHWHAAKRVLRFLKGTREQAIVFSAPPGVPAASAASLSDLAARLQVYCDADWAGCLDDRKSTSGVLLLLCGCPLVWLSKKQSLVAMSTAEAEYVAMATAVQEAQWLVTLLTELGVRVQLPYDLLSDNQAALSIARAPAGAGHARTKHIDLRHHFVRDCIAAGRVRVDWVATVEQLADVLTKGLSRQAFNRLMPRVVNEQTHTRTPDP